MKLDEYSQHCDFLKKIIKTKTEKQKREITTTLIEFCFLLPNFEKIIKKHILIDLEKAQLIKNYNEDDLSFYRISSKKAFDAIDEYSDDYEEIESLDLLILNMFENLLIEDKNTCIFNLFNGIIEILDYYEQFSERSEYWNKLLDKELLRQRALLKLENMNSNIYTKVYKTVIFKNA